MSQIIDPQFFGCIEVTACWVLLHSVKGTFMGTANNMIKGPKNHRNWAGRTFLNYLEQGPAFLVSMWIHAATFNPALSAKMGYAYICFAAAYPLLRLLDSKELHPAALLSTVPRYGINFFFATSVLLKLRYGIDLHDYTHSSWVATTAALIGFATFQIVFAFVLVVNMSLVAYFGKDKPSKLD